MARLQPAQNKFVDGSWSRLTRFFLLVTVLARLLILIIMHRSPMIKAHPKSPHLTKEQTRVPTAPLKSRPKGSALINDPLGIERDIISNFAEKIK